MHIVLSAVKATADMGLARHMHSQSTRIDLPDSQAHTESDLLLWPLIPLRKANTTGNFPRCLGSLLHKVEVFFWDNVALQEKEGTSQSRQKDSAHGLCCYCGDRSQPCTGHPNHSYHFFVLWWSLSLVWIRPHHGRPRSILSTAQVLMPPTVWLQEQSRVSYFPKWCLLYVPTY